MSGELRNWKWQKEEDTDVLYLGFSHYSPPPHEIIAPHNGIITTIGEGGYRLSDH